MGYSRNQKYIHIIFFWHKFGPSLVFVAAFSSRNHLSKWSCCHSIGTHYPFYWTLRKAKKLKGSVYSPPVFLSVFFFWGKISANMKRKKGFFRKVFVLSTLLSFDFLEKISSEMRMYEKSVGRGRVRCRCADGEHPAVAHCFEK